MTRVLKVVNMSNWTGEDYRVTFKGYDGEPITETIQPGQAFYLPAHISEITSIDIEAFERPGRDEPDGYEYKGVHPQMLVWAGDEVTAR